MFSLTSFPRKRESSKIIVLWATAFAGVTGFVTFYEIIKDHNLTRREGSGGKNRLKG